VACQHPAARPQNSSLQQKRQNIEPYQSKSEGSSARGPLLYERTLHGVLGTKTTEEICTGMAADGSSTMPNRRATPSTWQGALVPSVEVEGVEALAAACLRSGTLEQPQVLSTPSVEDAPVNADVEE
jgi:hypothetical protein